MLRTMTTILQVAFAVASLVALFNGNMLGAIFYLLCEIGIQVQLIGEAAEEKSEPVTPEQVQAVRDSLKGL